MLTCREVTERSSALIDGDLTFRDRVSMRMHIFMCVHCRRFHRQFRSLVASLSRRREAQPVSSDFVQRVMLALEVPADPEPGPEAR